MGARGISSEHVENMENAEKMETTEQLVFEQPNEQPGEPRASLLVEHWAKQTFAIESWSY